MLQNRKQTQQLLALQFWECLNPVYACCAAGIFVDMSRTVIGCSRVAERVIPVMPNHLRASLGIMVPNWQISHFGA